MILRLGGVISVDPGAMPFNGDALFFESALPTDGRIHTVDVRDVAAAFAAATTADVVGETLLIAGDDSHLHRQKEVGVALAAARGLPTSCPPAGPATPTATKIGLSPTGWTPTRAQQALSFQHHSWPEMLAEMRAAVGWRRYPMSLLSPVARQLLKRRAAYRECAGPLRRSVGRGSVPARRPCARLIGNVIKPANLGTASSSLSHTSLIVGKHGTACHNRSTGTWPATATVAECSSSETPGPTNVTPSR